MVELKKWYAKTDDREPNNRKGLKAQEKSSGHTEQHSGQTEKRSGHTKKRLESLGKVATPKNFILKGSNP
ncbi:hypothetical protein F4Z98_03110 [Candidatus Poribacteria bacterium]|nr:hypothetical protein [Candidatus Poribacteria bacterium]MYB01801.1 hypothetical protein [Candidatus Poribacteria bacterium]